jgi:hypothetical protein
MDEVQFWNIIESFDWSQQGDDQAVMQPAIDQLAQLGLDGIRMFDEILAAKLFALDTRQHAENTGLGSEDDPEDMFLYIRCCVVANGRQFYEQVLNDPSQIPTDMDFEALLLLTRDAAEKLGIEDYWSDTEVSYETFSNEEGWEDADIPDDLPPEYKPRSQR